MMMQNTRKRCCLFGYDWRDIHDDDDDGDDGDDRTDQSSRSTMDVSAVRVQGQILERWRFETRNLSPVLAFAIGNARGRARELSGMLQSVCVCVLGVKVFDMTTQ